MADIIRPPTRRRRQPSGTTEPVPVPPQGTPELRTSHQICSQTLYLDGNPVGTNAGNLVNSGATGYAYLGTGYLGSTWPDESHQSSTSGTGYASYFAGSMAEFAAFRSQLSAAQVAAQYAAAKNSQGLTPVQTVQVTDPGGKTLSWQYDPQNGDRLIAQTDGDGATTRYGYNASGFLATVTDPDGDVTSYGYDIRGNMVAKTQCQNQAAGTCSTSYYTYYPDDTTAAPAADPRNDMMTAYLDPRSASATDTRYRTSYAYNSSGETTPPVAGYPSGQTTNLVYTCSWTLLYGSVQTKTEAGTTCVDAVNGTTGGTSNPYPPGGLPYTQTTPGGAVTTYLYYLNGDVAQVTDPDGEVTKYVYDGLGRVTTKTVISNSFPNGLTTSYSYTLDGQVATETDPGVTDGVTGAVHTAKISTSYDNDGDVLSQTVADTTGGDASRSESFIHPRETFIRCSHTATLGGPNAPALRRCDPIPPCRASPHLSSPQAPSTAPRNPNSPPATSCSVPGPPPTRTPCWPPTPTPRSSTGTAAPSSPGKKPRT
jgi:YD repeat-containing protein